MKVNPDNKTVSAMDLLVPGNVRIYMDMYVSIDLIQIYIIVLIVVIIIIGVGELIGGSVREDRYDILKQNMAKLGINQSKIFFVFLGYFKSIFYTYFYLYILVYICLFLIWQMESTIGIWIYGNLVQYLMLDLDQDLKDLYGNLSISIDQSSISKLTII